MNSKRFKTLSRRHQPSEFIFLLQNLTSKTNTIFYEFLWHHMFFLSTWPTYPYRSNTLCKLHRQKWKMINWIYFLWKFLRFICNYFVYLKYCQIYRLICKVRLIRLLFKVEIHKIRSTCRFPSARFSLVLFWYWYLLVFYLPNLTYNILRLCCSCACAKLIFTCVY